MAKTVTAAEMKERERAANEAGLLYIQMMENAGRAAYAELKRRVPALRRLLIVAGKGNNGGDGFVMARVAPPSSTPTITLWICFSTTLRQPPNK